MSRKCIKKKPMKARDMKDLQKKIKKLIAEVDQAEKDVDKEKSKLDDFEDIT